MMTSRRNTMIRRQLRDRGIVDQRILTAFSQVHREQFVASGSEALAYDDRPLPIAAGQTISQPYIVALTIDHMELQADHKVLEVGTGSGYAAALLSCLVFRVITIERIKELADASRNLLSQLHYDNVKVVHGDGTLGYPTEAPYDAICVAAAGLQVPHELKAQLKIGGRLVIPVGDENSQRLLKIVRVDEHSFEEETLTPVRFVPLIGKHSGRTGEAGTR